MKNIFSFVTCLLFGLSTTIGLAQTQVTVTFDLNYPGADATIEPITIDKGNAMSLVQKPSPIREGYRLAGWYTDRECSPAERWLFGTKGMALWGGVTDSMAVAKDLTLYARWDQPVRIATAEEFNRIREDLYGWYILDNDINLSSFSQ